MERIVIALGGNALQRRGEPLEASILLQNVKHVAKEIATIGETYQIVIVHGNGPQVGLLALQNASYKGVSVYPLYLLDAQTQGMIGYAIANAIYNASKLPVVTLVTQVEVDPQDPAFHNPTKYIGPVYDESTKDSMVTQYPNWAFKKDNQDYRRVVPSPKPKSIIELQSIVDMLDQGNIVVACGGGGIPVVKKQEEFIGVDAVIDKDSSANLLADLIHADRFIILTDVKGVYQDFGKDTETFLDHIDVSSVQPHQYPAGSMGPKVAACVQFTAQTGKPSAIGALAELHDIMQGKAGTHFTK